MKVKTKPKKKKKNINDKNDNIYLKYDNRDSIFIYAAILVIVVSLICIGLSFLLL